MSGIYTATAWVKLNEADGSLQTVVSQDGDRDSAFFLQYSGQDQWFAMSFPGPARTRADQTEPGPVVPPDRCPRRRAR